MKGMSFTEWKEYEQKRRESLAENGIVDFEQKRAEKLWNDPNVPDEDIPHVKFTFDKKRKEFVKDE